jgi:hypothetical protein
MRRKIMLGLLVAAGLVWPGVAAHPGDRGMQALAEALFAALKNQK